MTIKFQPNDALVTVTSGKGMFKKLHLYPTPSTELNADMKAEDTTNGFSADISELSASYRRKPFELTILNSVLRYAAPDSVSGHAFHVAQGVSKFAGLQARAKLTEIYQAVNDRIQSQVPVGSAANKTGSVGDVVGALTAIRADVAAIVTSLTDGEYTGAIRFAFSAENHAGSGPPSLGATALADIGADYLWKRPDFDRVPGRYVLGGYRNMRLFGHNGSYAAGTNSSYISITRIGWYLVIDGPLMLPYVSSTITLSAAATNAFTYKGLPHAVAAATDPPPQVTRVTDFGVTASSSLGGGPVTYTDITLAQLGGMREVGYLLGAPTPVADFILDRCSWEVAGTGVIAVASDATDMRYTVTGDMMSKMMSATGDQEVSLKSTDYGMWLTNIPAEMPADLYTLIPNWSEAPAEDRQEIRDTTIYEEDGVSLTVDQVVRRVNGKRLKEFALILSQDTETKLKEVCTITASGPVFSTTADEWFGAYLRGPEYYSFHVEDGQPQVTAYEFVQSTHGLSVASGSSPIVPVTGPEREVFYSGGPRVGSIPGTKLFQALLSMHVTSREDVTDALKGMWANGMLVRDRYQA